MMENKGCLFPALLVVISAVLISLGICSCAKKTDAQGRVDQKESWAYIHDTKTEILRLDTNGKAVYKGKDYTYFKGDDYIELTVKDGNTYRMRFVPERDHMLLYETTRYKYDGDTAPDGIVGVWTSGYSSFEFTDKGTYLEDSYLPGHYMVNEEEGSIRLAYNDHFPDTTIYYRLEGDELVIDYPMPVVPTED